MKHLIAAAIVLLVGLGRCGKCILIEDSFASYSEISINVLFFRLIKREYVKTALIIDANIARIALHAPCIFRRSCSFLIVVYRKMLQAELDLAFRIALSVITVPTVCSFAPIVTDRS